jgi:hypothetical protein
LSQAVENVLEPPQGLKDGFKQGANLFKEDNKDLLEPPNSLKEGAKKGADKMGGKILALIAAAIPCLLIF